MTRIYILLLAVFSAPLGCCMTKNERSKMRETVKDMFHHAFNSYMTYAYPADELMPLNCKGRYRDTEPSRGDVDDILGNFSMTLIDSLDSLVIFGEISKFEEAVKLVINEVDFDNDIVVSTFETNIRVLGGLLGGHVAADVLKNDGLAMEWYSNELLDMAKDIGERLMPAFNTTTGIPYPKVNLMYGVANPKSRTGTESATCTACAGTIIMEFGALSRLTGDPKFETAAHKAMKALWTYRSRSSDLVGTVINIHSGEWVRRDSGVGAGIDSYYEYCLKAYILLGEEDYLKRFNQHYKAVMRYINRDSLFLNVHMNNPNKRSVAYMDSLQAFWPGLQVLKGDLQSAIELHEVFYSVAKRHTFLPEAFTTNFEVHWGQHFLRPELVESTYFLYEATKDPYYLEVGKYIVENLNRYTRVPCGFAAVKDVRTLSHENRMDSFLLSETLKYLYLLFTDKEDLPINLHDFVFTTEAHILPLALSNWNSSSSQQSNTYASENLHDHSCPRSARESNMLSFAENIRQKTRQIKADSSCPKTKEKPTFVKSKSAAPLLRAEQFIPGNKDHLLILKAMGITVTKTDDGKVQLMQDVSSADNSEMAGEGVTFMQSMIELAKFRSNDAEYLPRIVQILSPPYDGNIVLNAGPAQFGIDLGKSGMGVGAEVVLADPFKGCTELKNKEAADHRIVIMERGDCMFIDKVRVAESHGAVGVIVVDNNEGSSSESQPMFAMSGDGSSNDINIPAVFLFHNEGQVLQKSMQIVRYNSGANLRVRLADKALKKDANKDGTTSSTDETVTSKPKETIAEPKPELKQENIQEPISEPVESKKSEMDKIINIMQNVANQPGFEFLTGGNTKLNSKPSVMIGEINTADKRERWLYDVMMENWRERERQGKGAESKSGNMEEVVGKFKNGVFSVKARKVSGGKEGGQGFDVATDSCEAQKTKGEFVNAVVQHHKDDKHEIFIIGNVGDGKSSKEDMMLDITTLQEVVDRGETSHEEIVKGGGHSKAEEGQDEVHDDITEEKIVSRMDANDALDKDMTEKKQHTGSSVDLGKGSQGGKESQDERVIGNIASDDLTDSSATDITEPPQGTASNIEADVTKDEIKDDNERHLSKSETLGEQYASIDISGNDGDRLLPRTGNHDGTVRRTKSTEDGSGMERTDETSEGGKVFHTVSHESTEHENVRFDGENVGSEHEANKNFYIETIKQETITEEDKILKQGESMSENTHMKSDVKNVEELKVTAGMGSDLKYDNVDEKLTLDERTSKEQKQDSIHDSLIEQDFTRKNLHNSDSKESLDNSADRSWETEEKHTPDEL